MRELLAIDVLHTAYQLATCEFVVRGGSLLVGWHLGVALKHAGQAWGGRGGRGGSTYAPNAHQKL